MAVHLAASRWHCELQGDGRLSSQSFGALAAMLQGGEEGAVVTLFSNRSYAEAEYDSTTATEMNRHILKKTLHTQP